MNKELMITKEDLVNWLDRPPSNDDLDLIGFITTRLENFYKLEQEVNFYKDLSNTANNELNLLQDKLIDLEQENKQLKEALLDIKELQDNYLEEIYKGNVDLRLASSTLCKIDNIVNKALGDKENE